MSSDKSILAEEQILEFSKKIDFFTAEYTVEILADKVAKEEYFVPSYQRDFVWDVTRKSREGANKQVISSQADSLIKISRIWADFFPTNTSNQPI